MTQKKAKPETASPAGTPKPLPETLVVGLLNFYYPIYYSIGMDLAMLMCQGRISRMQLAILWLIDSRSGPDGWIRRKEIEEHLSAWFEITNSNISQLLRKLSKAPLSLITQIENPSSGREKLVGLTRTGQKFIDSGIEQSVKYVRERLSHNITEEELRWGVDFFAQAFRPAGPNEGWNDIRPAKALRTAQPSRTTLPRPPGRIEGAYRRAAK